MSIFKNYTIFLLSCATTPALFGAAANSTLSKVDIRFCPTAHPSYNKVDFGWEQLADNGCEIAGQEGRWFVVRKIGRPESVSYTARGITRKTVGQFILDGSFERHYNHGAIPASLMPNPKTAPVVDLRREASSVYGDVKGIVIRDGAALTTLQDMLVRQATVLESRVREEAMQKNANSNANTEE